MCPDARTFIIIEWMNTNICAGTPVTTRESRYTFLSRDLADSMIMWRSILAMIAALRSAESLFLVVSAPSFFNRRRQLS